MADRVPGIVRPLAIAALAAMGPALFAVHPPDRVGPAANIATASGNGVSRALVFAVQQGLVQSGFDPGAVDGVFGPRTRAAIRAFRVWAGVPGGDKVSEKLLLAIERRP